MPGPNQIEKKLKGLRVTPRDLLEVPQGKITEVGLRHNVAVGLGYLEAWFRGTGCVPLFNLMEDVATAEICRAQIWQWVHHGAHLEDGRLIDLALCERILSEELQKMQASAGSTERKQAFQKAADLMREMIRSAKFEEFLTLPAYRQILAQEGVAG